MSALSRRQLLLSAGVAGSGLLAGCARLPWQVERAAKVPRIAFLSSTALQERHRAFWQGLQDLGYVDGQNIDIEIRTADDRDDLVPELAAELVSLNVAIIVVAAGGIATRAARNATSTIPIVMCGVSDPVALGFVASLARPGGNVTGLATLNQELSGKRLDLLRDIVPGLSRVAVLGDPGARPWLRETEETAQRLGLQVQMLEARTPDDLDEAFASARTDALLSSGGPMFFTHRTRVVDLAAKSRLPAMYEFREFVRAGGLMSYGPNLPSSYKRAAYYVDRMLKGAKPADLPVERPREFDFVINLKTAQALGLTIPRHVLLQATEVIE